MENSFQFFFHTEEIKDRRIFHDISVHVSHVKTGVIFGVMPSKKNNSLVTPDEIMTPTFDSERCSRVAEAATVGGPRSTLATLA